MTFLQKLEKAIKKNNSLLCVGLDPDITKFPKVMIDSDDPILEFNKAIIDATYDIVCAFKPQIAYYSAHGVPAIRALKSTIEYINETYPHIPVILDAKRGDIGPTAQHYTQESFEFLDVDAVTVNPYLGFDSVKPFLERKTKGIIILCRTSNPSATDFQDLKINGSTLYIHVAKKILTWHKKYKNCLMVVGATWPRELKEIRTIAKDMFFLVPGIGAQGGDIEKTVKNGKRKDGSGLIMSSSRAILYASKKDDFAKKAREVALQLRDEINQYR